MVMWADKVLRDGADKTCHGYASPRCLAYRSPDPPKRDNESYPSAIIGVSNIAVICRVRVKVSLLTGIEVIYTS